MNCAHDWDYTGSEACCTKCRITASQNPCEHRSIAPPTFGAYRCNHCRMTFSAHPSREDQRNG